MEIASLYHPPRSHGNSNPPKIHCNSTVSCVDSTSSVSGHQVILLQQNGRNDLTVLTIRSGTSVSLPLPSGRYCILELPMVFIFSEFIAEYPSTKISVSTTTDVSTSDVVLVPGGIDKNIITSS